MALVKIDAYCICGEAAKVSTSHEGMQMTVYFECRNCQERLFELEETKAEYETQITSLTKLIVELSKNEQ